jgi:hypothetical protein
MAGVRAIGAVHARAVEQARGRPGHARRSGRNTLAMRQAGGAAASSVSRTFIRRTSSANDDVWMMLLNWAR